MRDAGGEVRLTEVTALFLLLAAALWGVAPTLAGA
jgi:hypothetical protein